eukprot:gene1918-3726_t
MLFHPDQYVKVFEDKVFRNERDDFMISIQALNYMVWYCVIQILNWQATSSGSSNHSIILGEYYWMKNSEIQHSNSLLPIRLTLKKFNQLPNGHFSSPFKLTKPVAREITCVGSGVKSIFYIAGPVLFLGMQVGYLQTASQIAKEKSVGKRSPIPNLALVTNCAVWTMYGFLTKRKTLYIPNTLGVITGLVCTTVFHRFSEKELIPLYFISGFLSLVSLLLAFQGNVHTVGIIGCALSILLSGAPLATIATVLRDRSTASLPFLAILFSWISSCCWMSYGILIAKDIVVLLPNLIGFLLRYEGDVVGQVQMKIEKEYLLIIYSPNSIFFDITEMQRQYMRKLWRFYDNEDSINDLYAF